MLRMGAFLGVPIKIHYSIVLTFGLVAYVAIENDLSTAQTLGFGAYFLCLFICVLLHEYGHILMARHYGIETQDIILSPIGGIARLKGFPNKPGQEIIIALAGPLVNVIIVLMIRVIFWLLGVGRINPDIIDYSIFSNPIGFLHMVMVMNGFLCLFNLIPAFPMDGGRVFRGLLSYKMSKEKATYVASIVGRVFAVAFIALGIYNKMWVLVLIGVFVFFAAGIEYAAIKRAKQKLA